MGGGTIVQVEDGKSRTGRGMAVDSDGNANVSLMATPKLEASCFAFSVGTSSSVALAAGDYSSVTLRNNDGAATIFLQWGSGAATTTTGFPLAPGAVLQFSGAYRLTTDLQAIVAAGTADLRIAVIGPP